MGERELFLPVGPEDAARVMRARAFPPVVGDEVTLSVRRAACPGGVAVGVRVEQERLRRAEVPGRFVVERWEVGPERFTRAYQPWHVDVEPDSGARWQAYLHPNMGLTLRNLVGRRCRTRWRDSRTTT